MLFNRKFDTNIDVQAIVSAASILSDCGIAFAEEYPFAGCFVKISKKECQFFLEKVEHERDPSYVPPEPTAIVDMFSKALEPLTHVERIGPNLSKYNKYKILRRYHEFGRIFIENALADIADHGFERSLLPASDRLVSSSDNQEAYDQSILSLDELSKELESSNEAGDVFGDNREIVESEISALRRLITGARVRAEPTLAYAKKCLGWIMEKAGIATIGELAKRALTHLIDWLS